MYLLVINIYRGAMAETMHRREKNMCLVTNGSGFRICVLRTCSCEKRELIFLSTISLNLHHELLLTISRMPPIEQFLGSVCCCQCVVNLQNAGGELGVTFCKGLSGIHSVKHNLGTLCFTMRLLGINNGVEVGAFSVTHS